MVCISYIIRKDMWFEWNMQKKKEKTVEKIRFFILKSFCLTFCHLFDLLRSYRWEQTRWWRKQWWQTRFGPWSLPSTWGGYNTKIPTTIWNKRSDCSIIYALPYTNDFVGKSKFFLWNGQPFCKTSSGVVFSFPNFAEFSPERTADCSGENCSFMPNNLQFCAENLLG